MEKNSIEKEFDMTKCPNCGYYNRNKFLKKYGKCNRCKLILDKEADFKYEMIKKLHLFKKGQAGFFYKEDKYS